uniref:Transposase-associated domain-containing protein n=1 Tax=Chenopodium quinoa TaxID=63459 RepID=A0A803MUG7_CHEQI
MDKSWITTKKPGDPEYDVGVVEYIKFAVTNSEGRDVIPCPCHICHNLSYQKVDVILVHLSKWEFDRTYTCWYRHGESRVGTSSMGEKMDNSNVYGEYEGNNLEDMIDEIEERVENDPDVTIEDLISDSEKP